VVSLIFDRNVTAGDIRAAIACSFMRPDHRRSCSRAIRGTFLANSRNDRRIYLTQGLSIDAINT